ncbi:hypothetical protein [Carboxydothermus hydrogenoformans]|uniref:Conserved domain protein n=1 Tax=Carboxydothermus hydrogenoformans (strain ATCC BAA-161 / DSM 6008 / Z-2901) TaxID=246194 RepID=Q3ABK0_CARHZ|nr:hypothetical protein [Carboxydothermus hydrogenoformans]ABB14510.1 conserved domain protein [Carboxydothermus hydrogenoformans Z-2901]
MRVKTVKVAEKTVTVRELKIKEIKETVIPLITEAFGENITNKQLDELIPFLQENLLKLFPELTQEDLDEAYMSQIEELVEAWLDVNFFGVKKIIKPLLSFSQQVTPK